VCIGRAADVILKDEPNVVSVFLDAPYEFRIEREMERQGISRRLGLNQCVELIEEYVRLRLRFGVITEKKVKE
jgi:cytidylate kinase